MDLRNRYQSQANRQRAGNDIEELQQQQKWVEWPDFTAAVTKLRNEWAETGSKAKASFESAWKLMVLLVLGLYSCIPARGKEFRALQFISEDNLRDLKRSTNKFSFRGERRSPDHCFMLVPPL